MISYNALRFYPAMHSPGSRYSGGWKRLPSNDIDEIAKCALANCWSPIVWKSYHRVEEDFEFCEWLALDFDSPEVSLQGIKEAFADCICFIGTTKSHQKEKGGVICDRFRLVARFEKKIADIKVYKHTLKNYIEHFGADKACKDGARFFFPCVEIVHCVPFGKSQKIYEKVPNEFQSTLSPFEQQQLLKAKRYKIERRGLPPWVADFLTKGDDHGIGRNSCCYAVAMFLIEHGYKAADILNLLKQAPFDHVTNWSDNEIITSINSAVRKANKVYGRKLSR